MVRVAGAIVNARLAVEVCAEEPESVTLKLSGVAVTGAVGVPLMTPVDAFRARPFGKVPAVNCHVKAPVPPVAARLCEYATPTWPLGDRKSTRLNSSHLGISYAVFCLKKNKI